MQQDEGKVCRVGFRPSVDETASAFGTGQTSSVADIYPGLYRQPETIDRLWFDRFRQAMAAEADLFARLMGCNDPGRAIFLWNAWLLEQTTEFVKSNQRLARTWLDFHAGSMSLKVPPGAADSASMEPTVGC
ncbi:hypothetical protein [Inquilinus sp. CA228]|uniref:hypothetical protein n=1 Tax=Inquilinus sp. CA228 TaxID=3455609 RepID=UPI003F8D2842